MVRLIFVSCLCVCISFAAPRAKIRLYYQLPKIDLQFETATLGNNMLDNPRFPRTSSQENSSRIFKSYRISQNRSVDLPANQESKQWRDLPQDIFNSPSLRNSDVEEHVSPIDPEQPVFTPVPVPQPQPDPSLK
jgi:hypothetical protein